MTVLKMKRGINGGLRSSLAHSPRSLLRNNVFMFDHLKSSLFLCELYSLHVDLVIDQLVDESHYFISLDSYQDKGGARSTIG